MSTTVYIQLSFTLIGDDAKDAGRAMMQSIEAGRLDLPMLATLRDEYRDIAGDWRITGVDSAAELHHEVQP